VTSSPFREIDFSTMEVPKKHALLLGAVAPRPIAFAATMDKQGRVNLSPFSFFNCFSANPPVVIVSPSRSGRDGLTKDTLEFALETRELTISVVSRALAEQANLASSAYARGTDEFVKAGLTKFPSVKVKPPGVAESPAILECKLLNHVSLGDGKAAGQLLIAEVVHMRVRNDVLTDAGMIDPVKIDQVARMGGEWYTRAAAGLFELPKPPSKGLGIDGLPKAVRESSVLTGQELAMLGILEAAPTADVAFASRAGMTGVRGVALHQAAKKALAESRLQDAWQIVHLIAAESGGPSAK
jgi:flavin reductase (DIM6/NTAB) family NADH-FMN oxidoreductase RutF